MFSVNKGHEESGVKIICKGKLNLTLTDLAKLTKEEPKEGETYRGLMRPIIICFTKVRRDEDE